MKLLLLGQAAVDVAAATAEPEAGNVFLGLLIWAAIFWFLWALFKPRGYDVHVQTKGRVRPR